MADVPGGGKAYEVHYSATANFDDLLAKVAEANAAVDSLQANAAAANKSSIDSDKALTDAEKAKSDAFSKAADSAAKEATQQTLLNKAAARGFNSPQDDNNFRNSQEIPSYQNLFKAKTGGRTTADQALQDMKNTTAARLADNAALDNTKSSVDDLAKSYENTSKATKAGSSATIDLTERMKQLNSIMATQSMVRITQEMDDLKKAADDTGVSYDTLTKRVSSIQKELTAGNKNFGSLSGFDSFSKGAIASLTDIASKFEETSYDIDDFSNAVKNVGSTDALTAMAQIQNLSQRIATLREAVNDGNISFAAAAKESTSLASAISKLDKNYSESVDGVGNSVSRFRSQMDRLSSSIIENAEDLDGVETVTVKADKSLGDFKKTADDAKTSTSFLSSGLKMLAADFDRLAAASRAEGGSGGIGGFLGSIGSAASGGISGALSGLGSLASAVAPALALAVAIPMVTTAIVGLGGAIVGLLGALAPLVGVLATFLPIILGVGEAAAILYIAFKPLISVVTQIVNKAPGATTAFKKLSEPMQQAANDIAHFIQALKGAGGALSDVGTKAITPLLGPLGQLNSVIKPITEALNGMASSVGEALQPVLQGFINFLKGPDFQSISAAAATGLVYFGQTVANVLDTLEKLAAAAAPYTVIIAKWFETFTKGMDGAVTAAGKNQSLTLFFNQMITALYLVGNIIGGIGKTFATWGEALSPIGNFLLAGLGNGLNSIAADAKKVDFSKWNTDIEAFLVGLGKAAKGLVDLFGSLVNPAFLTFLGAVLADIGKLAEALKPIVDFFVDIVKGSLPALKKGLDEITSIAIGDFIKPLADFFGMLEKHPDIMKGLSTLFTALAGLVVSASLISVLGKLSSLASASWSSLAGLLNKLPGFNLPGATTAADDTATVAAANQQKAADTMLLASENNLKAAGLAGGESAAGAEAGAEGAAAADVPSMTIMASIVSAVIGLLVLGAGAALLASLFDPTSSVRQKIQGEENKLNSPGTPGSKAVPARGTPGTPSYVPAQPAVKATPGGLTSNNSEAGKLASDVRGIDDGIARFFEGETEWQKGWHKWVADAGTWISNLFTGKPAWEAGLGHALSNMFLGNSQWEKDANTAFDNFFTGKSGWQKTANSAFDSFFTNSIPHWFDSFAGVFNRNIVSPVGSFVTKTLPSFFTSTIPHWYDAASGAFTRNVYNPVKNWVTGDFVNFFTTSIPKWFSSVGGYFTRDVYSPVKGWVETDFVGFFTTTIPKWFSSVGGYFTRDVYDPIDTFITTTVPGFFTKTIPHWFDDVGHFFTTGVIDPIKNYLVGTGSGTLLGDLTTGFTNAFNAVINTVFNNGIIRLINDAITVVGIPKIPNIPKLATGGHVPGNTAESDTSDSMLARLTPGEFVVRKRAAQHLGPQFLESINHADSNGFGSKMRGFAGGGGVPYGTGRGGTIGGSGANNDPTGTTYENTPTLSLSSITDFAKKFIKGALKDTFDAGWGAIIAPILTGLGSTVPAGAAQYMGASFKKGVDTLLGAQDAKAQASSASINLPGNAVSWINQGMAAAGVSGTDWQSGLEIIAQGESGGNQGEVNTTDSNAQAGHPSAGLMQFIQSTFDTYAKPGYTTWMNPVDQVVADAWPSGYIKSRYGTIDNVPGVKSVRAGGPYVGYADGGFAGGMTGGMGFASAPAFAAGGMVSVDKPGSSSMSPAAAGANGGRSGPHIENFNVHNAVPERVSESYASALNRLRVYGAHQ